MKIQVLAVCLMSLPAGMWAQSPASPIDAIPLKNWEAPLRWLPPAAQETLRQKALEASNGAFVPEASPSATGVTQPLQFVGISPCRLMDTRSITTGFPGAFGPPSLQGNQPRVIPIPSSACGIPSSAAYSLNFTLICTAGPVGFVAAWPDDKTYPGTSITNAFSGGIVSNAAVVAAGPTGGINVMVSSVADLVIDINGYYVLGSPNNPAIPLPLVLTSGQTSPTLFVSNTYTGSTATDPTFTSVALDAVGFNATGASGTAGGRAVLAIGGAGGLATAASGNVGGSGGIGLHVLGGSGGNSGSKTGGNGGAAIVAAGGDGSGGVLGTGFGGRGLTATGGAGGPGSQGGVGVFAIGGLAGGGTAGNAGIFAGDVIVTGTLSKGGGSFRIDHPLDPAHKYLSHSFVESPDMKNIYDGSVRLDSMGTAWVELPDWFETLNRDFRYQLTPIGAPAPGLFIAEEVQSNRFKIAGGKPGGKVSWMITGTRQDAYAMAHRIPTEEVKPAAEQNTYLHPELYGQPEEMNVLYALYPDLREELGTSRVHTSGTINEQKKSPAQTSSSVGAAIAVTSSGGTASANRK